MTINTLVKKHSGIATVVILATASIAALLFLGIQAANQFNATEESWHRYNDQTRDVSGSLNALQRHLGYGGFIHNFKNFILRREPSPRSLYCKPFSRPLKSKTCCRQSG